MQRPSVFAPLDYVPSEFGVHIRVMPVEQDVYEIKAAEQGTCNSRCLRQGVALFDWLACIASGNNGAAGVHLAYQACFSDA